MQVIKYATISCKHLTSYIKFDKTMNNNKRKLDTCAQFSKSRFTDKIRNLKESI